MGVVRREAVKVFPAAFHPRALVESRAVGPGTRVWAFAHVCAGACVGRDCNVGEGCYLEAGAVLGDRVTIKNGVCVWDGVTLESDAFVGPNVAFTNDPRPRSKAYHEEPVRTVVRRGASLGANATILSGIEIGEHAMIGAGAVVTRSVPAHALAYGNPAEVRGFVCACSRNLAFRRGRAECACGLRYGRRRGGDVTAFRPRRGGRP